MKLLLTVSVFIAAVHAVRTSYILSVEESNVPSSFMDSLKQKVKDIGGYVTREFSIIKGFTAELDDSDISKLQGQLKQAELRSGYSVRIEKDSSVHALAGHEH